MTDDAIEQKNPLEPLEKWFGHPRKTLEEWRKTPPHAFGLAVLFLVSLEFVLAFRLFHGLRLDFSAIGSAVSTAVFIAAGEALILLVSNGVASFFNKRGRPLAALTSFNAVLLPLLLFLPFTLYFWASGGSAMVRFVILLLLIAKVLSDWKEVIRINYRLSGIQTYMLAGVLSGVAYVGFIAFLVLSGFGVMVETLSKIGFR